MSNIAPAPAKLSAPEPRPKTVVCVTDQRRCDRIILAGRRLADLSGTDLAVINVARPDHPQDPGSIEYLFTVSKERGAEMTVLYSTQVPRAMTRYLKENAVAYVLTGQPQEGDSVVTGLWRRFPRLNFFVVGPDGELQEITKADRAAKTRCAASL